MRIAIWLLAADARELPPPHRSRLERSATARAEAAPLPVFRLQYLVLAICGLVSTSLLSGA